jgi:hypothetical protein
VRPVHRVAQQDDQLHVRDQALDPVVRGQIVQIERGGLAAQRPRRRGVEQRLVVRLPPDVLLVGLHVAGTAAGRRAPVGEKELGLLHPGQEQVRVLHQRGVQGRGPRLRYAGDEEVR